MLDELLSAVRDYGTACSRFSEDFDPEYETACVEAFAAVRAVAERMLQPARPGFSEFAPIPIPSVSRGLADLAAGHTRPLDWVTADDGDPDHRWEIVNGEAGIEDATDVGI